MSQAIAGPIASGFVKHAVHLMVTAGLVSTLNAATSRTDDLLAWDQEYKLLSNSIDHSKAGNTALGKTAVTPKSASDRQALIWENDRDPLDVVLRRTDALARCLSGMHGVRNLPALRQKLADLRQRAALVPPAETGLAKTSAPASSARYELYQEACALRKSLALSNPLIDFDTVLILRWYDSWAHVGRGHGHMFQPVGGIYALSGLKSGNYTIRNVFTNSTFQNGTWQGQPILGLKGAFHWMDLSYDATTIVFGWVLSSDLKTFTQGPGTGGDQPWIKDPLKKMHIFKARIDGTGLQQLTFDGYDDKEPCWMPDGRIVFTSGRPEIAVRCNYCNPLCDPQRVLHSMKADGSDLYRISFHETMELYPSVDNDGRLVYTRWDYLDRDFSAGHHLWTCYPDGADPRSPHGNYPPDECTDWQKGRNARPYAEFYFRAIPNTNGKYIAIAGTHHGPQYGVPIIINTNIPDDRRYSQITKLIPDAEIPQDYSEGLLPENAFMSPWPLSEQFYLAMLSEDPCVQDFTEGNACGARAGGLYLMDALGNRTLISPCTVPEGGGYMQCVPLRKRPVPPNVAPHAYAGERAGLPDHYRATLGVVNINNSDFVWPAGVKIKRLRINQWLSRPWETPNTEQPDIDFANGTNARMCLGTVPVEADGSVYFEAPVNKNLYFQALDERGVAIQSMRSGTYVHPGEQLVCTGCHEDKWKAVPAGAAPLAFKRAPSTIQPESPGSRPLSFGRMVRPVFQNVCLPCHQQKSVALQDFSYGPALRNYIWALHGSTDGAGGPPWPGEGEWLGAVGYGGICTYRSTPGNVGALASKMGQALLTNHTARVSADDLHRVTLWLDLNSAHYGVYTLNADSLSRMDKTEDIIWPTHEVDPANPAGVESDRPLPNATVVMSSLVNRGVIAQREPSIVVRGGSIVASDQYGQAVPISLFDPSGRRVSQSESDGIVHTRNLARGVVVAVMRTPQGVQCKKVASIRQ